MSLSAKRKGTALSASDPKKAKSNGSIAKFFGGSSPSSSPTSSAWDKDAWVKKLTQEQRQLLDLEINTLHESWLRELKNDITSESFLSLKRFLRSEAQSGQKIFPPSEDVYSWCVSPRCLQLLTPCGGC